MENAIKKYDISGIGSFEGDGVYRLDLSQISETSINSITIFDDSIISGGDGAASGFDLDYIALSSTNTQTASDVKILSESGSTEDVFDFVNGVIFTPGFKRATNNADWNRDDLFGTSNGNIYDSTRSTLDVMEAKFASISSGQEGGLALGEGGSVTFTLKTTVAPNDLFLYLADVGGGNDTAFVSFNTDASKLGVDLKGTNGSDLILLGQGGNVGVGAGDDIIDGAAGNDSISTISGNDIIDGGSGIDTALLTGKLSDYKISKSSDTFTIQDLRSNSPDGIDTVTNIEKLQFSDQTVEIDADGQSAGALNNLFNNNADAAKGLSAAYTVLLGGIPNQAGFEFLIGAAISTNFGAGVGVSFNSENIFINLFNNLVQGNNVAKSAFDALASGSSLEAKVGSIYKSLIPVQEQTDEGLAFFIRAEGLVFYQNVAAERGVAGTDGAAIVAMASLVKIAVDSNIGIGNSVNDLFNAVSALNAIVPIDSDALIDLEFADGGQFDGDDASTSRLSHDAPATADEAPLIQTVGITDDPFVMV